MSDILASNFTALDFNSEKFVKDLSSQCVGAEELRQQRANIQDLSRSTSAKLKRNVYQNYVQFIETAKEISHLESEMYQLSQLLCEQRSLLSALGINQTTGIEFEGNPLVGADNDLNSNLKEEDSKKKLLQLLENIDGAMNLIDTSGRVCLHEGSLLELDPIEGTPLKKIHAYLFNDILMIASWLPNSNRIGPSKYKLQAVYDLKSLAVVNIRDLGTVKLAFKLLAFPDTRIFQCTSAISKKEWIEKCDQAKKLKISNAAIAVNADIEEKPSDVHELQAVSEPVPLHSNTFGNKTETEYYESLPEWILEVTEDLDSCIAQRHFEEAFNLLKRTRAFIQNFQISPFLYNLKVNVDDRSTSLLNVLKNELEMSAEAKSLQGGGLRSARKAVKILIHLGRSAQACHLYLRLCTAALKASIKRVKREGSTLPYIKQLSAIAFSNIFEMSQEFLKLFSSHTICNSALLIWCSRELRLTTSHIIKQMFIPQVSLTTLAECIMIIRDHCEQLTSIGMDFRHQLDGQIRAPLMRVLQDTKEKHIDAVKVRSMEDTWKPSNLQTAQQLHKLLSELDDLGISLPQYYIQNDYWLPLTNNTLTFSKQYVVLLEDCLNVATPEIMYVVEDVLASVLKVQMQYMLSSLASKKFQQEKKLWQDNMRYIHNVIINRSLELYKSVTGQDFKKLIDLQQDLCLDPGSPISKPRPTQRTSITKYSTTEYI